mgnify:CR=1 FL=1
MSIYHAESERLRKLRASAERIAAQVAAPRAEEVDRRAQWPSHTFEALAQEGLLGLNVPASLGGHGQGLTGLLLVTEAIARACSSSGLSYGMHNVATAVMAARATRYQEEHFLEPIARGEHVTALAIAEAGTGSHLYLTETAIERQDGHFLVRGQKQFVTSGGHADSYVATTLTTTGHAAPGQFNMLVVEKGTPGVEWGDEWNGLGMRGNAARAMKLQGARVDVRNLLGEEGDQNWYMFEIVVPYFILAMAATYLGVAQAALDDAITHVRTRRFGHSGELLSGSHVIQQKVAALWAKVEKGRRLVYHAASLGDRGDEQALPTILTAKAEIDDLVVHVTNEAMTLGGGQAYRDNARLARLLRDARAGQVMSPTTDLLRLWAGRVLLGLPIL